MATGDTRGAELPGQIGGPGKLVRLHAGQEHQAPAALGRMRRAILRDGNDRVAIRRKC